MEFGVPKIRQAKVEKYPNDGCFTFLPTGEKLGRKVILNQKAIEKLSIEGANNQISFSFNGDDIYVVNTSGIENCAGLKVGKTSNAFADKKQYEYIKTNIYKLKEEDELELFLEDTDNVFNENVVYKLVNKGSHIPMPVEPEIAESYNTVSDEEEKVVFEAMDDEKGENELQA